jgi:hypothetical protein
MVTHRFQSLDIIECVHKWTVNVMDLIRPYINGHGMYTNERVDKYVQRQGGEGATQVSMQLRLRSTPVNLRPIHMDP